MLIDVLNKLNSAVNIKNRNKKNASVEDELEYLNSLGEPVNDFERSYFQYLCTCFLYENKFTLALKNVISLFGFLYYLLIRCRKKPRQEEHVPYVLVFNGARVDIVPDKYDKQFRKVQIAFALYLTKQDKRFIREIWNCHPFSFYFIWKCVVKIATYRAAIEKYHPKHILCSCENSYTSSIMTLYCERLGMKHINLMHAVVPIRASLAFHRFSISSIWSSEVMETHRMLRAGAAQYEIEIPKCLRYRKQPKLEQKGIYKYYLQDTTDQVLNGLAKLYQEMQKRGISMILRPHPVYSKMEKVNRYIPNAKTESVDKVDIELSINKAEYVIARNSTVLWQAQLMNKKVIIDDVSMPEEYEQMKKRRVFLWETGVEKMSDFLKNKKGDK